MGLSVHTYSKWMGNTGPLNRQTSISQKTHRPLGILRFGNQSDTPPESKADVKQRLEAAKQAARKAGDIIMRYFRQPLIAISAKASGEVVTQADQEADTAIQDLLRGAFPGDDFLTEESYDPQQTLNMKSAWIIDPLDATRNFANRIPHFAVSIAYVKDGKPTMGVIYDPAKNEMFTAVSGEPTQLNGEPVAPHPAEEPKQSILSMCNPIPEKFKETKAAHRRMGCSALDMAYVASGRYGAACERNLKVWDIAAGIPMVEGAGGQVTDFDGKPIDLNRKTKVNYLASNGKLHQKMLNILSEES